MIHDKCCKIHEIYIIRFRYLYKIVKYMSFQPFIDYLTFTRKKFNASFYIIVKYINFVRLFIMY